MRVFWFVLRLQLNSFQWNMQVDSNEGTLYMYRVFHLKKVRKNWLWHWKGAYVTKYKSYFYPYFSGNFTCLEVIFKFRRRLGYYLFHTYIPTCLIVMMSWISFWIKPEAVPARVTLGVTSLLTLSTQHANSQKSLPPVSYIKVLS